MPTTHLSFGCSALGNLSSRDTERVVKLCPSSLAVEGLNREEIGIEEIFIPNEAESNGQ